MFSPGEAPFAEISVNELLQFHQRGKTLKKPHNCSNTLWVSTHLFWSAVFLCENHAVRITLFSLSHSGTPSLKAAATGRSRIDPLWLRLVVSSSQERRVPLTKSSRRLSQLTSRSTCRMQDTETPTTTLFSDRLCQWRKWTICSGTKAPLLHFVEILRDNVFQVKLKVLRPLLRSSLGPEIARSLFCLTSGSHGLILGTVYSILNLRNTPIMVFGSVSLCG